MYDNGNNKVLTRTVQYTYDANGNQLSEYAGFTHPNNTNYTRTISASAYGDNQQAAPDVLIDRTLNTYDGFNRLVRAEKIEAGVRTVTEYTYNGDDLRVRKTVRKSDSGYTPQVTCFLYDRQHVILETDGSGNTVTRYIRGINYIAQYSGTEFSYYLYNGHGDVVQTVSASGEILNHYDYDIFGNPVLTIETAACNIRYAGEYLDKETGLYYLRARYYDPYIGRFISEDSYWGEDDNPLSLNLYTYCFNDPIRFIDPTGHDPYDKIIANARTQSQINWIINEINKQKEIWFVEEQGAGKDQTSWTGAQTEANRRAETLRQQLIQLESGNADTQRLIKDDSKGIAGAWEGYQLSVTARLAEANPGRDYSDMIRRQAQDYALAEKYGRNVIGIDASMITEETRTAVERFAEDIVAIYRISMAVNSLLAEGNGDFESVLVTADSGRIVFPGPIFAYRGNDFLLLSYTDTKTSTEQVKSAEELLIDLIKCIESYPKAKKHILGFWGIRSKEQKEIHESANEIRDKIKETYEYKNDPEFAKRVDNTFTKKAYKNGNTKEEVQKLIDYLQEKKKLDPDPEPESERVTEPEPIVKGEGTGNSSVHQSIIDISESMRRQENWRIKNVEDWTTLLIAEWKLRGDEVLDDFENQWISGYKYVIQAAARKYDIPAYLLAGVAKVELGGDPLWIDDIAYNVRQIAKGQKAADLTSFGNISIQVRRAAETLGYDYDNLTGKQRESIISSIKDPIQNLYIVAKHLSDLRDIEYKGLGADKLTEDNVRIIGSRYWWGPDESLTTVKSNTWYGNTIVNNKSLLEGLIYEYIKAH